MAGAHWVVKSFRKKCSINILNNSKKNYIYARPFFVLSNCFVIKPISFGKNNFKILDVYIFVKRPLEKLHLHPQWGQDKHNSPHQRGAASKAEQPLFVQKKTHLKTYKKLLNL